MPSRPRACGFVVGALGFALAGCPIHEPRCGWPHTLVTCNDDPTVREIEALSAEDDVRLHELQLDTTWTAQESSVRVCGDGSVPASCAETCTLADDVADNSAAICNLASQRTCNEWQRDKCRRARAASRKARTACCACAAR